MFELIVLTAFHERSHPPREMVVGWMRAQQQRPRRVGRYDSDSEICIDASAHVRVT